MLYSDLSALLGPVLGVPFPAATAPNTDIPVIGTGDGTAPAVSIADIETALSTILPGDPISAVLNALPPELSGYVDALTNAMLIENMDVAVGAADAGSYDVNGFGFIFELSMASLPPIGGVTLDAVGVELNMVPFGSTVAWSITLFAQCTFCGVDCTLSVDLSNPSITIMVDPEGSADINTILGAASDDPSTNLSSVTAQMGVNTGTETGDDPDILKYFIATAALSDNPTYGCGIGLDTSGWVWSACDIGLTEITFAFTYGAGGYTISLGVDAVVGGLELTTNISYSSAQSATSFSCADTTESITIAEFLTNLCKQFGFQNPLPLLDDIYLTGAFVNATDIAGVISVDAKIDAAIAFDNMGTSLAASFEINAPGDGSATVTIVLNDLKFTLTEANNSYMFGFAGPAQIPLLRLVELAQLTPLYGIASDIDIELKDAVLVLQPQTTDPYKKLFALEFDITIDVQNDTLNLILNGEGLGLTDARITAGSLAWSLPELQALENCPVSFDTAVPEGVNMSATLQIGSIYVPTPLLPPNTNTAPTTTPAPPKPVGSIGSAMWFNVQKQIGPVDLQKVGLGFDISGDKGIQVELLADAAFTIGPFTAAFDGFSIDIPFRDPSDFSVGLKGLELSFEEPPLGISGGLLQSTPDLYVGNFSVSSPILALSAIGEYGTTNGHTTLAIFGALTHPPLGGPGFCFINGLSAGAGYNSHLNVPQSAADVASFALVEAASTGIPATDPFTVIINSVTPKVGDDWMAVGVNFTSYDLIQSTVLMSGSFGSNLEFDIFGQSEMSIPPMTKERLAYAQLDVEARFVLTDFMIFVEGALSRNSFILDPNCHITGGFVFRLDGDGGFIISYGGYADDFDWQSLGYPALDRVGLSWQVDALTSIVGQTYFALTPAAMMAGGDLQATFSCGVIAASFTVSIEFLIQWRPFWYSANFAMQLTVSFDMKVGFIHMHFNMHLGAELQISGPAFHGYADIDLDIIHFKINFGDTPVEPDTLNWDDFRAILPGNPANDATASDLLSGKVTNGLRKVIDQSDSSAADAGTDWVVNGTDFAISLQCGMPITQASSGAVTITEPPKAVAIGILPMQQAAAQGRFDITLTDQNNTVLSASTDPTALLVVTPITQQMSSSQWGTQQPDSSNAPPIECTGGFILSAGHPVPDQSTPAQLRTLLADITQITATSSRAAYADPFAAL